MMNKQVAYICNVCTENSFAIEGQSKNYVVTLEPSFVCAKCFNHFNPGYKVTDKESKSYECKNSSEWSMKNPDEHVDCGIESRNPIVTDQKSSAFECRASCEQSMNSPCEYVDYSKESRLETQLENNKPKQSNEGPQKCNVGSAVFKNKRHVTVHKKTHNDLNPLRCKVCNKIFVWKSYLERHMTKHTDSKPHGCNICNRTFKWEENLKRHMLKQR